MPETEAEQKMGKERCGYFVWLDPTPNNHGISHRDLF